MQDSNCFSCPTRASDLPDGDQRSIAQEHMYKLLAVFDTDSAAYDYLKLY